MRRLSEPGIVRWPAWFVLVASSSCSSRPRPATKSSGVDAPAVMQTPFLPSNHAGSSIAGSSTRSVGHRGVIAHFAWQVRVGAVPSAHHQHQIRDGGRASHGRALIASADLICQTATGGGCKLPSIKFRELQRDNAGKREYPGLLRSSTIKFDSDPKKGARPYAPCPAARPCPAGAGPRRGAEHDRDRPARQPAGR